MKRLHLAYALACLLAGAAAPAFAQTTAGVADPQAAVPATIYRPATRADAAPAPAAPASPDQAWRAANATVGGRNPMSLTMPGMGGAHDMGGHDMHGAGNDGGKGMQCMSGGAHAAGMSMPAQAGKDAGGMQCMAGGSGCCGKGCCGGDKCCCAGKPAAADHANHAGHTGHAGMAMDHGCCDHEEAK